MAGIAGIFVKSSKPINHETLVLSMMDTLGSVNSECRLFSNGNLSFGIKSMVHGQGCKAYATPDKQVRCIVDGNVFPGANLKKESDLPALYRRHGRDIVHRITGWFNVFIHDADGKRCLLFNSRFGMLPIFVYENEDVFLFCSKISGLAVSKMFIPEWDKVSQLEHAIFNYPISEHTFLKNVFTVSPATLYEFSGGVATHKKYWDYDQLLDRPPLSRKNSIDLINTTFEQVVRKIGSSSKTYGLSLTGGWDGRLVLSSVLKNAVERVLLYSFGAKGSTDISIPAFISEQLKLPYKPFILDDDYVDNHFSSNALDTIWQSSGYRNYLRSHYLYAMRRLSEESECVLSGNCGSNLLKFSEIVPGAVLSSNLIELIQSSFSLVCLAKEVDKYKSILGLTQTDIDEFYHRVKAIGNEGLRFGKDLPRIYFYFLVMKVERKFFGFELSSYNDHVYNFSPFIDFEFIDALSKTIYWGPNYPFNSHSNNLKIQSFDLYKSLMMANYPKLCDYKTDRGATFHQLNRIDGKLFLFIKRKLFNPFTIQSKDTYNTGNLRLRFVNAASLPDYQLDGLAKNEAANILSTQFFRQELFGRLNS
jgi:Glutamine amidotransferase domain